MRILYLHQYFKTPEEGGGIRSYYLGQALAARGHEVQVLTSWNGRYEKVETIAGMQVHYLPVPYSNSMGFWERGKAFLRYLWLARQRLKQLMPVELVYASSTPLTVGLLALYLRRRYQLPYIFEVRDLWPEAPIQLGAVSNKALIVTLQQLEKSVYRHAAAVVALSPGIAAGVKRVHSAAEVHLAPNMADCTYYRPESKPAELLAQWGLENKFVIAYTGAAGRANRLENLLLAAQACQAANLPVHFLVAAAGGQLEALKQESRHLCNLSFMPYGNREAVRRYLSVSDAVYVSFGPQPVLQSCSPNKFFDGLAAGKLCIVSTQGWLRELVEGHACGFYAPPQAPETLVERLQPYLQHPHLLARAQQQARQLAESMFSRQATSTKVVSVVEAVAQRSFLG